jgi:hypothetical protein
MLKEEMTIIGLAFGKVTLLHQLRCRELTLNKIAPSS